MRKYAMGMEDCVPRLIDTCPSFLTLSTLSIDIRRKPSNICWVTEWSRMLKTSSNVHIIGARSEIDQTCTWDITKRRVERKWGKGTVGLVYSVLHGIQFSPGGKMVDQDGSKISGSGLVRNLLWICATLHKMKHQLWPHQMLAILLTSQ